MCLYRCGSYSAQYFLLKCLFYHKRQNHLVESSLGYSCLVVLMIRPKKDRLWQSLLSTNLQAETHYETHCSGKSLRPCDNSPRLHFCCDKAACAYFVPAICRMNLNQFEYMRQITATMIFTCHTKRFDAATCCGDVSQRFVAECVSALSVRIIA